MKGYNEEKLFSETLWLYNILYGKILDMTICGHKTATKQCVDGTCFCIWWSNLEELHGKLLFCCQAPEIQSNSPSSSLIQKSVWYICIGLSQYSCRLSYNTLEGLCFALVLFFLFSWIFVCSNTEYEHSLYPHDQCWGLLLISSFYQWLLWFQIVFKSKSWGGKFSLDTCETLDKWMSFDILFIHYL